MEYAYIVVPKEKLSSGRITCMGCTFIDSYSRCSLLDRKLKGYLVPTKDCPVHHGKIDKLLKKSIKDMDKALDKSLTTGIKTFSKISEELTKMEKDLQEGKLDGMECQ